MSARRGAAWLAALIAAVHQVDQMQLPVLLIGAGLPHLPGKACDAKSYSERLFQFPELARLSHEDSEAALVLPASRVGVEIEKAALGLMVEASEGYPYFIQQWGNCTWDVAKDKTIGEHDAKAAESLVEARLDQDFYQGRMGRLTQKEIEYLRAMANIGAEPYKSADIAEALGVQQSSMSNRRKDLINKGMIYSPSHGELAFSVPMFDKYLKRAGA